MSSKNRYLASEAAVIKNPITFTPMAGVNTVGMANVQLVIDAIEKEGTDATDHRLFLDEMSPVARVSLYKILVDLKASLTAA